LTRLAPLSGGDLSQVAAAELATGETVIAKSAPNAEAEAGMLDAIRATGCPAPRVIGAAASLLVLERLDAGGRPDAAAWETAGRAIARLHRATGARYGWSGDHAFGPAAIPNAAARDWPAFWADRRLLAWPEALPRDIARRVEALARALPDVLPKAPAPALLHGDLWSGNLLWGRAGFSGVIDPAAYHGDPEVDLAMLTLFGAPPASFWRGYGATRPGLADRRPVYQLWPALVHLRLFGDGYRGMVETLLARLGH
jgi:fructosamine-3-kinase